MWFIRTKILDILNAQARSFPRIILAPQANAMVPQKKIKQQKNQTDENHWIHGRKSGVGPVEMQVVKIIRGLCGKVQVQENNPERWFVGTVAPCQMESVPLKIAESSRYEEEKQTLQLMSFSRNLLAHPGRAQSQEDTA